MSRKQKQFILIAVDSIVFLSAYVMSFKFLEPLLGLTLRQTVYFALLNILIYIALAINFNLFKKIIRFFSVKDSIIQAFVVVLSSFVPFLAMVFFGFDVSFRFSMLSGMISLITITSSRILWRVGFEHYNNRQRMHSLELLDQPLVRTLIVGAGEGGALFIEQLFQDPTIKFVGIVDDDKTKQNTYVHSVPVIGQTEDIVEIIDTYEIDQVTIAIPSLTTEKLHEIIDSISETNVKINQMPSIEDLMTGKFTINRFKEIDVVDLLGRDEVKLDMDIIDSKTKDEVILVTGAGGSIGSEICRQLMYFKPSKLLLLGHGEYSIYKIHRELNQLNNKNNIEIVPLIADIQDRERIDEIMQEFKPTRVYHAAAHKHVPMMQSNPREAVKNNIYGTKNMAEMSKKHGVKSFVMVSTDKAVNPPNVMGATKRIAEMIVTGLNEKGKTKFVAVRFGNVLNSRGSVIPVFKEQLQNGGPLTVTDFRMTRYFMTIPEASRLVLQAGALAKGGEIFVLDMGEPVKIVDLAKKIIQLSGYSVDQVGIKEIGIRPGEKLYEELLTTEERVDEQVYEKIFVGNVTNRPLNQVLEYVGTLNDLTNEELAVSLKEYAKSE